MDGLSRPMTTTVVAVLRCCTPSWGYRTPVFSNLAALLVLLPYRDSAMAKRNEALFERRVTTWSTIAVGAVTLAVGVILLAVSSAESLWHGRLWAQALLAQLGGLFVVTGLLSFGWELIGRRNLADEVFATARLGQDVKTAGLVGVTDQYLEVVEWDDLFRDAMKVDICVAYARTWRNAHRGRLEAVAARRGARLQVFLPDPADTLTMKVLAARFDMTPRQLSELVREAIKDFGSLRRPDGATVKIFLRKGDVVFSCYRFDSRAVLTLYSHARKRQTRVPTFVVEQRDMFQFVYEELKAIEEQSTVWNEPATEGSS